MVQKVEKIFTPLFYRPMPDIFAQELSTPLKKQLKEYTETWLPYH